MIGYSTDTFGKGADGYIVMHPTTGKVTRTLDVTFNEAPILQESHDYAYSYIGKPLRIL